MYEVWISSINRRGSNQGARVDMKSMCNKLHRCDIREHEYGSYTLIGIGAAEHIVIENNAIVKGKSSRKILMEFEHLRKRYWDQHIWARGYFAVTVGNVNDKEIQEYIENQEINHKQDNFLISEY
jgi:hypothetical protein